MRSQPPPNPRRPTPGPLADCLIALAGTPDDSSWIASQLVAITQLAADLMEPSCHASATAYRDDAYLTVAASSDHASAVDQAQYADQAGPCLDALDAGFPVAALDLAVPDLAAPDLAAPELAILHLAAADVTGVGAGIRTEAAAWPGFRAAAERAGFRSSLSVPLFAGRGTAVAALNLYGQDRAAMASLAAGVEAVYAAQGTAVDGHACIGNRDAGLITGLAGAFAVRALVQEAIGGVMADTGRTADAAYLLLRLRAAETGISLTDTATAVMAERQWETLGS